MSLDIPVAFLIFNRPDLTDVVFNAIAAAKPKKLFVIADGPRFPEEEDKCRKSREIIQKIDWDCRLQTNYSDINLGCKRRVSSGIDWVFSEVEEAIFLEDDCLPAPSFFNFCQVLLERYRNDTRVMHIRGSNFLFGEKQLPSSYYFSRYPYVWGWASWRRAWKYYDPAMKSWPDFERDGIVEAVFEDKHEQDYWRWILGRTFRGEIDTWDFQWFYTCWTQNGLVVAPGINLVSNLGFRQDATHTNTPYERSYLANIPTGSIGQITHPPFVVRNREADSYTFEKYFGGKNPADRNDVLAKLHYYWSAMKFKVSQLRPTYNEKSSTS